MDELLYVETLRIYYAAGVLISRVWLKFKLVNSGQALLSYFAKFEFIFIFFWQN